MSQPYEAFSGDINVKVDLSNYATKADIKNISHVGTSSFALKTNLANLKNEVDKLDIDKLVTVPVDLSKLSDLVKNDVIKKTDYNAKIADIEGKIPDVTNLATKTALTAAENKIPSISILVEKTDYDTEITEIQNKLNNHNRNKYITTPKFNTLTADVFNARLSQANFVTKTTFDNTVSSLDSKIAEDKTKNKSIENEL